MNALDGVYAKLDRARVHARELEQRIECLIDPDKYRFVPQPNGEPCEKVFRIDDLPVVGQDLSAILGDCILNIRSSLDHLAWQLAKRDGWDACPVDEPQKIKFPIYHSDRDKHGKHKPARIYGVRDPAVKDAVEVIQPYKRQVLGEAKRDPLWILNELCNIDKHRLLLVIVCVLNTSSMYWGTSADQPIPRLRLKTGPLKDHDEVAWFAWDNWIPKPDFDPHLSLTVKLNEGPPATMISQWRVMELLTALYSVVEHSVVGMKFGQFFGAAPRHGASLLAP